MKKQTLKWISILAIPFMMLSCSEKKEAAVVDQKEEAVSIKVQEVKQEIVAQNYDYSAVIRPEAINNIAPATPGRIKQIFVEVGDFVNEGQLLVQMDATQLVQSETQLNNLRDNFKRIDELYKVGGASKSSWDDLKTQLDVAEAMFNNLKENTQLLSPISGVVTARNYDSGDLCAGNAILQIQQIKPVKLLVNISESQYKEIHRGMDASVAVNIFEGQTFEGKVSLIYPTLNASTHTFPVEIRIPNSNAQLRPGMYAQVMMNMGDKDCVLVPDQAIVKQPGSGDRYVFALQDNGTVSYVKVLLDRRVGDHYVVLSGIKAGDKVAVTSLTRLKDQTEVKVVD